MNPDEKKDENNKEEKNNTSSENKKPQRKLKFKTLDGNVKHLECDYDIKISELKKKLAELYNIEPNRQRLLNKGKQFKDDEFLDKLVDKDDTTIHLVFRSEADVKRAQEAAQNNNNPNQNNQNNQNNPNVNPFQNFLNSDAIRNLTNNIVSQLLGENNNTNNNNNNNNSSISISIPSLTGYQTLNVGESLNLNNSPLQPIQNSSNISQSPPALNLNNDSNQNNNITTNNNEENQNSYSGQFPITSSATDKKYEMHLKNIEKELSEADKIMSQDVHPRIPLPLLNTTQNVFTAISRSIRKYVIVNQNILCNLMRLADLMEREQYITQSDTRMNGNKLLDQAYKTLAHISKASNDLSNVIKSSNFNTAPNTGYIGIICQEIGYQTQAIPVGVGELNTNSILSALRMRSNNNNNSQNNNNINVATININNLGNLSQNSSNNNNNQNISEATLTIPIGISTVNASEPIIVNNNNINQNNANNTNQESSSNPVTTTNLNAAENENNKNENKDNNNKESNTNNDNNNNNTNANINNTSNNNEQNNDPNDFNNLFRNTLNELMTPENINSIAGAVDSMMNNNASNPNSSPNQNPFNFGQLIGNLLGSLGGENANNEISANGPVTQNTQQPQNSESNQKNEQIPEKKESEQKNEIPCNECSSSLFKKLVDNPQLRKETKISDEKNIGEEMIPNVEFSLFSKDIIANLTVQEIFDLYNLKFSGFARLRKDIQSKYFADKSKSDEIIKKIIELLCERFILIENQLDKLIPGKEFILEDFFNKKLKNIFLMFIDDNEVNVSDEKWEEKFRQLIIDMLKELIEEIKNIYETGEDGAKYFFEFNIVMLIENFIGTKYLNALQNYNSNLMTNFVENLFNIVKTEETKKKEETVNDNNNEKPGLLSIEEIFKIANNDKDRLEKEEKDDKEKNNENKDGKKYSEFYYLTSLFK